MLAEIDRGRPVVAAIHRFEEAIAADVENARVVRRHHDWSVPVEAVLFVSSRRRNNIRGQIRPAAKTAKTLGRRKRRELSLGVLRTCFGGR